MCIRDRDYKFPDNNTGNPAFIGIYDGTFTTNQFESFGLARDATIEIGANGTFIVETQYSAVAENDGNRYNVGNLILEGAIYASQDWIWSLMIWAVVRFKSLLQQTYRLRSTSNTSQPPMRSG